MTRQIIESTVPMYDTPVRASPAGPGVEVGESGLMSYKGEKEGRDTVNTLDA